MKNIVPFILLFFLFGCTPKKELVVLQFNIWQEGTVIDGGFNAVIDEVIHSQADLIALSEVRNYNGTGLDERLLAALRAKGFIYYSERSEDSGILSRYPIVSLSALYPVQNDHGSITKAVINMEGVEIAFYSAHLDYRNCSLYLSRGYSGTTWKKLNTAIADTALITADNLASKRDEAIDTFIKDSALEREKGRIVILGGDFNDPSHLDWIEATKDMFDHNSVIMPWRNTLKLERAGFSDVYRERFPNPVTHPGFTFPADNRLVEIKKLAWSPEADDRDRIDFIFYHSKDPLKLKEVKIIGPTGSIVRNQRLLEKTDDPFEIPIGIWPTDHKAIWAKFEIISKGSLIY